jgi:hypothetical protein
MNLRESIDKAIETGEPQSVPLPIRMESNTTIDGRGCALIFNSDKTATLYPNCELMKPYMGVSFIEERE